MNKKCEEIRYIQWGLLTGDQWEALSVVKITKPSPKDNSLEHRMDTPADPRLGEQKNSVECSTCGKVNIDCPGHLGSIRLPFPVYNLRYINVVMKLLQCICVKCARPRIKPSHIPIHGFAKYNGFDKIKALADKCNKSVKICPYENCGEPMTYFSLPNKKKGEIATIYYNVDGNKKGSKREEFSAKEAHDVFSRMTYDDLKSLSFNVDLLTNPIYSDPTYLQNENMRHAHEFRPEAMIYTVIPVLPPSARPYVEDGDGIKEDDLTTKYNDLLKSIIIHNSFENLDESGKKSAVTTRRGHVKTRADIAKDIINHIWTLCDNKEDKTTNTPGAKSLRSITCRMMGKDGRIQQNVSGKRTDYSARGVIIGGGVDLRLDELGVPEDVAEKETMPEIVGSWNFEEIQEMVRHGKVNYVKRWQKNKKDEIELNTITFSKFPDKGRNFTLRVNDEIGRQLRNGDVTVFNRQPTLSVPSILAFKTKIVKGQCFKLPLYSTTGYNAD